MPPSRRVSELPVPLKTNVGAHSDARTTESKSASDVAIRRRTVNAGSAIERGIEAQRQKATEMGIELGSACAHVAGVADNSLRRLRRDALIE